MLRLAGCDDPLIGRPLAVYDLLPAAGGTWDGIDLIYHVKGRFTTRLARCQPGQTVDVWGPLGNGFPVLPCLHLVMVAGGVGQTPFLTLAKEHLGHRQYGQPPRLAPRVPKVTLCFGAQTRDLLAGVRDFESQGVEVRLATDDGSLGHHGLVTEMLDEILAARSEVAAIARGGPRGLLWPRADDAGRGGRRPNARSPLSRFPGDPHGMWDWDLLLVRGENPPIQGEAWDYKRTCVEGPVFDAESVCW